MLRQLVSIIVVALFVGGCGSEPKFDTSTAEGAYKMAQAFDEDERYEEAIIQYNEVRNKHPYSQYSTRAELRIADIQFKREYFVEAQAAYQTFLEFHPKHPRAAYVTHRLALSYFNQLPSTVDRDLSPASNAIAYFDQVVERYPSSKYVDEAIEKKKEALKMLAGKVDYIGNFYFIREHWLSAQMRYEMLLQKYPGLGFDPRALSRLSISLLKQGKQERAKKVLAVLKERHPDSREYRRTKSEFE